MQLTPAGGGGRRLVVPSPHSPLQPRPSLGPPETLGLSGDIGSRCSGWRHWAGVVTEKLVKASGRQNVAGLMLGGNLSQGKPTFLGSGGLEGVENRAYS